MFFAVIGEGRSRGLGRCTKNHSNCKSRDEGGRKTPHHHPTYGYRRVDSGRLPQPCHQDVLCQGASLHLARTLHSDDLRDQGSLCGNQGQSPCGFTRRKDRQGADRSARQVRDNVGEIRICRRKTNGTYVLSCHYLQGHKLKQSCSFSIKGKPSEVKQAYAGWVGRRLFLRTR